MLSNTFTLLRTLALALLLGHSYATINAIKRLEEPTREITGPNGEPLWDFLFVQKTKPAPVAPVQPGPKERYENALNMNAPLNTTSSEYLKKR